MYDQDPLSFYGHEDEANARDYRKRRRLTKIDRWRDDQVRHYEGVVSRALHLISNTIMYAPAMG